MIPEHATCGRQRSRARARGRAWIVAAWIFSILIGLLPVTLPAAETHLDEDVRAIALDLRCPVCQNLSVGDSPSELAQEMRQLIREQLQQGKTPGEVLDYFVARYGEWILLAPPKRGFNLVIWLFPVVLVPAGIVVVYLAARRWVRRGAARPSAVSRVDPASAARLKHELDAYE